MANYHTISTASHVLPVSRREAHRLNEILRQHDENAAECMNGEMEPCGFEFKYDEEDGTAFLMTGDETSSPQCLPAEFLEGIGVLIAAAGLKCLQIGFAHVCGKQRVSSHGGGYCRIYPDGDLVFPTMVWPESDLSVAANALLDDYDSTGCDSCGVVGEELHARLHQILVHEGLRQ